MEIEKTLDLTSVKLQRNGMAGKKHLGLTTSSLKIEKWSIFFLDFRASFVNESRPKIVEMLLT